MWQSISSCNCELLIYMLYVYIKNKATAILCSFVTENWVKSHFREWAVDWNRHPDVHISQRWKVLKDSNLESQLGKGPRQCVNPMGKTSDCSFVMGSHGTLSAGGCDRRTKRSREELPHVRGQGQKPGGPHAWRAAAKRSYPTSKVRGSSWDCQAATAQGWPREATQRLRSGAAAGRSHPTSKERWLRGRRRP